MDSGDRIRSKRGRSISAAVLAVLLASFVPSPVSAQSGNLVWSDEFNGTSLDTANWTYDIGNGTAGWGNSELQYYTDRPENVRVENGNLVITCIRESYKGYDYTSARIKTKDKQSWTYGRIEARIKVPCGIGLWPAFWMLGRNMDDIGWPKCGEIDIMEHINLTPYVNGTMHWENNGHQQYGLTCDTDMSKYHVYVVEWDSKCIRWSVDGREYCKGDIQDGINGTDEFQKPFFMLLNLAAGGRWPGSPGESTVFPASMYVDYVRAYSGSVNWYLTYSAVSGVSPMGLAMQTDERTVTGWKPSRSILAAPACWYSPAGNYKYRSGIWSVKIWTDNPGEASNVKVELYKTNTSGTKASLIGTCIKDVAVTGAGNHPTTFEISTSKATSLKNQRLMVKISLESGKACRMIYNTNDCPGRLETP